MKYERLGSGKLTQLSPNPRKWLRGFLKKNKFGNWGGLAFTVASRLESFAGATPCLSDGTL